MQPLTWNANREQTGRTARGFSQYRTDFHVKWVNYLLGSTWRPIDMTLSPRVNVYEMRRAPFQAEIPVMSTGQALFISDNRYSPKNQAVINDAAFNCLIRPIGPLVKACVGDHQGDKVVYKDAYGDGADYILQTYHGRVPRLRKLVQINKPPVSALKLEFELELPDKYDLNLPDIKNEAIISKDATIYKQGSLSRIISFSRARIWDSNPDEPKSAYVQTSLREQGGRLILTKYIPVSFFKDVVFPVFTDTDFYPVAGTTEDGYMYYILDNQTWATLRAAATATGVHDDYTYVRMYYAGSGTSSNWKDLERSIFVVDTSAIGTDEISAASWFFYFNAQADANSWTAAHSAIHLVSAAPAADNAIVVGDYDSLGNTTFGNILYADFTTAYEEIALNAAGILNINKIGNSRFGCKCGADFADTAPARAGNSQVTKCECYAADNTGTSKDPYLSVTHAAPIVTLTADAGSYTLTGTASSLLKHSKLSAEAGSYSITGATVSLFRRFTLVAASGTYAITGTAATLLKHWKLAAGAGNYTLTGQIAALKKMSRLVAGAGSYTLTGQTVALKYMRKLTAQAGSYILTGAAIAFNHIPMWAAKSDPSTSWTEKTDPSGTWTEKTDPSTSFSEKTDSSTEWTEKTDPSSTWT